MIDLRFAVVTEFPDYAAKRAAIVTVTQLADLGGQRVADPIRQTAVVDIMRGPQPEAGSFSLPNTGIYEISVRHPGGIETREVTLSEDMALSISVGPNSATTYSNTPPPPPFWASRSINWPYLERLNLPSLNIKDLRLGIGPVFNHVSWIAREMFPPTFETYRDTPLKPLEGGAQYSLRNPFDFEELPFEEKDAIYAGLRGWQHAYEPVSRWFTCIEPSARDLVSIPWGWVPLVKHDDHSVRIEMKPAFSRSGHSLPTRVEVHDSRWGALLDYVTAGRMADAERIADSLLEVGHPSPARSLPEWALYGKVRDPMVATLGGLILVSTVEDGRAKTWDRWLQNLAHWYPGLPDGAALFGYRRLQLGEIDQAKTWLRQSVQSGMPFFSATFRLLALGFSQLEDQEYLDKISGAAAAVDTTQPFTVIRIPWRVSQ
uniref:hypothetical protein n=1 Tax=Ensifer adhaerens TaxID=106592 RepID=UPI003F497763